jgi:hypothetical protein
VKEKARDSRDKGDHWITLRVVAAEKDEGAYIRRGGRRRQSSLKRLTDGRAQVASQLGDDKPTFDPWKYCTHYCTHVSAYLAKYIRSLILPSWRDIILQEPNSLVTLCVSQRKLSPWSWTKMKSDTHTIGIIRIAPCPGCPDRNPSHRRLRTPPLTSQFQVIVLLLLSVPPPTTEG